VDDDAVNQAIVKRFLGSDYQVHTVMDGEEACKFLKSNPIPDAVLLDSMMPRLTGPEVLKVIRQDWDVSPQELPILMVSAACSPEEVIEALDLGASDHISKPFDSDVLKARLRMALRICGATQPWVKNDPKKAATDDNFAASWGLRSRQGRANKDFRQHRTE
jgi:DNA-binding response OmpR family regulator